jgi:hypothetical protein
MFSLWSPIFRFPLSGDVSQEIEPEFGGRIAGVPEIEAEVIREVASYGRQLGKLTEAVLALAEAQGLTGAEVAALRALAEDIEGVKARSRAALRRDAETALARLRAADEPAWRELVGPGDP